MRVIRANKGFTLLELLLVLVILAALTYMVVPRFTGRSRDARIATARADVLLNLATALDLYEMDNGRYPTTEQGLEALIRRPAREPAPLNWNGPYLKRPVYPADPWGNRYVYRCPPRISDVDYELLSLGPDGLEDTGDDIVSWEL
jgi:general secretion pathway protein G